MKLLRVLGVVSVALVLACSLAFASGTQAPEEEAGAKKEIRVFYGGQAYFVDTMKWAVQEYMTAHPDTTVTLDLPAGDLWAKLKVLLAAGSAPDLFRMDDEIYPSFAITGTLMDLTDRIKNEMPYDDYFLLAKAVYTFQGKMVATSAHALEPPRCRLTAGMIWGTIPPNLDCSFAKS